jgi:hypothetical protein
MQSTRHRQTIPRKKTKIDRQRSNRSDDMKATIAFLSLLFLTINGQFTRADENNGQKPKLMEKTVRGDRASLTAAINKQWSTLDAPLSVTIANTGNTPIHVFIITGVLKCKITLSDEAGSVCQYTPIGKRQFVDGVGYSSGFVRLAPGESTQYEIQLEKYFELRPGAFLLDLEVDAWIGDFQIDTRRRTTIQVTKLKVPIAAKSN